VVRLPEEAPKEKAPPKKSARYTQHESKTQRAAPNSRASHLFREGQPTMSAPAAAEPEPDFGDAESGEKPKEKKKLARSGVRHTQKSPCCSLASSLPAAHI
jgi:hypothetical protein